VRVKLVETHAFLAQNASRCTSMFSWLSASLTCTLLDVGLGIFGAV